jgi:hypothetical protein
MSDVGSRGRNNRKVRLLFIIWTNFINLPRVYPGVGLSRRLSASMRARRTSPRQRVGPRKSLPSHRSSFVRRTLKTCAYHTYPRSSFCYHQSAIPPFSSLIFHPSSLIPSLHPVLAQPPVQPTAAQAQRLGGFADVAVEAREGAPDQVALDLLEAHVVEIAGAVAG